MFLDRIKNIFGAVPLSWRLTIATFLISAFTLGMTSVILFNSYKHFFKKVYAAQLCGYMDELAILLEEMQEYEHLAEGAVMKKWIESELTSDHYSAMLLSKDHQIIGVSGSFPMNYSQVRSALPEDTQHHLWGNEHSGRYMLGKVTVYQDTELTGYIFAARNLEEDYKKIHTILLISIWVCLLTSLITALLSFIFSKTILSPIMRFSSYINSIKAKDLHKRLNPHDWPSELRPVVYSFDQMLMRLEDNFIRLNQFSSDLAHELRTPIHQMKIAIEVTLSKERTAEDYIESLSSTLESAQKLNRLVEDILFIARAESKNTAIKKNRTDITALSEKIKDFFQISLEENNISFDISQAKGILNADEQMLSRAIINIVNNSISHLQKGGNIKMAAYQENSKFIITISNDGPAIEQDYINNIFDRFFKADYSRQSSQDYSGSGLGLSIAQSIMRLHDGSINVLNLPDDKGIEFKLTLPLD